MLRDRRFLSQRRFFALEAFLFVFLGLTGDAVLLKQKTLEFRYLGIQVFLCQEKCTIGGEQPAGFQK